MTSLTKNLHPRQKIFFRVQSTRLADPFELLISSLAQSAEELGRYYNYDITHKKSETQNQESFFSFQTTRLSESVECLKSSIVLMVLELCLCKAMCKQAVFA